MKTITVQIKGVSVTAQYDANSMMPISVAKTALVAAAKTQGIKGAWSAVASLEINL